MRFEDWDVLLFARDSKVPVKEFKTNCHVVHDNEFAFTHGSHGLPTMTCFIPGLPPGVPFNISLHSWKTPDVSQFTKNYSKHTDLVKFEARVFIDGRLVASSSFSRTGPWPQLINHSFEFTKNGDLETLRFPPFRNEVLRQSYWSPADEVGRIRIVISEGFPRDSLTVPIERVKNIVAFSFQHAPLHILESSGIAWPNPSMWRRTPLNPTLPVSSQQHEDGPDAHLHSPRRRTSSYTKGTSGSSTYNSCPPGLAQTGSHNLLGSMPNTQALLQRGTPASNTSWADPFSTQKSDATACFDWASNNFGTVGYSQVTNNGKSNYNPSSSRRVTSISKMSHSDASMADYCSGTSSNIQGMTDHQFLNLSTSNLVDPDAGAHDPKVPTNTPTTLAGPAFTDDLDLDISKIGTPGSIATHYLNGLIASQQDCRNVGAAGEADKYPTTDASMNEFFNSSHVNFSADFANTLTHSLLNQPHPLSVHPGSLAPPAPEVKSRKENCLHQDSQNEDAPAVDRNKMRKVSQSSFSNLGKEIQDTNSTNSPPSQSAFSGIFSHRSASTGDFGDDLTNVANAFSQPSIDSQGGSETTPDIRVTSGSEKGTKRPRHFTPTTGRIMGDDGKVIANSPRLPVELEGQFGEAM
ncbi:hypothetical protein F5Y04DRAFT_245145 [Hypomontagnella monticulosa]|nr:hypothetical protein F5Y04DRAFT_245145 [Hypomontagnella monticulosa]